MSIGKQNRPNENVNRAGSSRYMIVAGAPSVKTYINVNPDSAPDEREVIVAGFQSEIVLWGADDGVNALNLYLEGRVRTKDKSGGEVVTGWLELATATISPGSGLTFNAARVQLTDGVIACNEFRFAWDSAATAADATAGVTLG